MANRSRTVILDMNSKVEVGAPGPLLFYILVLMGNAGHFFQSRNGQFVHAFFCRRGAAYIDRVWEHEDRCLPGTRVELLSLIMA